MLAQVHILDVIPCNAQIWCLGATLVQERIQGEAYGTRLEDSRTYMYKNMPFRLLAQTQAEKKSAFNTHTQGSSVAV